MKVKRGVIYNNIEVFHKNSEVCDCLIFENGFVISGDNVAVWYDSETMITGQVCGIAVGGFAVAFRTTERMNIWITLDDIKGCAKKIDGKWVSMREVK